MAVRCPSEPRRSLGGGAFRVACAKRQSPATGPFVKERAVRRLSNVKERMRMAGELPGSAREHLDALSRMLVSVEGTREATMSKIADLARGVVPGSDYVSITVVERGRPETVGATDDRAVEVDAAQYRSGSGPCLDAITNQRLVRVPSLPDAAAAWGQPGASAAG